jgi:hypothetical protein
MAIQKLLPMKYASEATLSNGDTEWINHLTNAIPLPVIAKKAYFSTPAAMLPDTGYPYGSGWVQHLGQITYFTPAIAISPAWVTTYIKFYDNFVGQRVKIVLNNSEGTTPIIMHDWEAIAYSNGSFQPTLQDSTLVNLKANVSYWVEVFFDTTVNKAPGFYGQDGIEGFLAKYWWSISQAPVDNQYLEGEPSDLH